MLDLAARMHLVRFSVSSNSESSARVVLSAVFSLKGVMFRV